MTQQFKPGGNRQQTGGFAGVDELRQGFVLHLYELLMRSDDALLDGDSKKFSRVCQHLRSAVISPESKQKIDEEIEAITERMKTDTKTYSKEDQEFNRGFATLEQTYNFIHKVLELTITDTSGTTANILEIDLSELGQDFKERTEEEQKTREAQP